MLCLCIPPAPTPVLPSAPGNHWPFNCLHSWTIKKAERRRIDAFELWGWRKLLRVPWTAKKSNQSILKEISPEYSLEGLIWSWNSNTLSTWCKELTHCKRSWCWERLKAGGKGGDSGCNSWMASPTRWTWVRANSGTKYSKMISYSVIYHSILSSFQ